MATHVLCVTLRPAGNGLVGVILPGQPEQVFDPAQIDAARWAGEPNQVRRAIDQVMAGAQRMSETQRTGVLNGNRAACRFAAPAPARPQSSQIAPSKEMTMFRFRWIDLFAALAALLFAVLTVTAAPAPVARPKAAPRMVERLTPRDLAGEWVLTWGECEYRMTLSAFGAYRCWIDGGHEWVGTYDVGTGAGILVSEQIVREDGTVGALERWALIWSVDSARKISVTCPSGSACYSNSGTEVKVSMRRPK